MDCTGNQLDRAVLSESIDDIELRRLRWRCRRGMRELDQLMLRYLDQRWSKAPTEDRELFLQILETEDDTLWRWIMGREISGNQALDAFIQRLIDLPA